MQQLVALIVRTGSRDIEITLMPGQRKQVNVKIPLSAVPGSQISFVVDGEKIAFIVPHGKAGKTITVNIPDKGFFFMLSYSCQL